MNTANTTADLSTAATEAIEAISKTALLTAWRVSCERKWGRKWELEEKHYLDYAQAKGMAAMREEQAKQSPKFFRNVSINPIHIFTHTTVAA